MTTPWFRPRSLLVSCQAQPDSPLHGPRTMALMAAAADAGGADGIRANGPDDVAAIRQAVGLPVIGLRKAGDRGGVYITPTVADAAAVVEAGADLVAIDGTTRARPDGTSLREQIEWIHAELEVPVIADVDGVEAGVAARAAGADLVATTLSGYTDVAATPDEPDIGLVSALAAEVDCPVVAEGRYWTAAQVADALDAGATAVVVGTAITNPTAITERLRQGLSRASATATRGSTACRSAR